LTDLICRAVQPSIQSATNTLTRNSSIRGSIHPTDTGDYAIPQPLPHHHIITHAKSNSSLIRCGSCPGSAVVSRRGSNHSSSESSPPGTVGNTSVIAGSDGHSMKDFQGYYTDTSHYDRMPMPIPVVAPQNYHGLLSEDEIEPAYATVFPNTMQQHNIQQTPPQQSQIIPQQNHTMQMNYQSDDRNIYRRGARRWRKLYRINGHIFQAKRFNRVSFYFLFTILCFCFLLIVSLQLFLKKIQNQYVKREWCRGEDFFLDFNAIHVFTFSHFHTSRTKKKERENIFLIDSEMIVIVENCYVLVEFF
jgi:hypothetical protein